MRPQASAPNLLTVRKNRFQCEVLLTRLMYQGTLMLVICTAIPQHKWIIIYSLCYSFDGGLYGRMYLN